MIFSCIHFSSRNEAAAFAAAVSRFVSSPAGVAAVNPVDVDISAVLQQGEAVDVYLNEAALTATLTGFAAPHVAGTFVEATLPAGRIALVAPGERGAFGKDEMLRRLGG